MSLDHNSEIAGDIQDMLTGGESILEDVIRRDGGQRRPDLMVLLTAIRGARDLSKQILPASAEGAEQ